MNSEEVWDWISKNPVPPAGTLEVAKWHKECGALGPGACSVFILILKYGAQELHETALLGLREFGYEAWGITALFQGKKKCTIYKIKFPQASSWQIIDPLQRPTGGLSYIPNSYGDVQVVEV